MSKLLGPEHVESFRQVKNIGEMFMVGLEVSQDQEKLREIGKFLREDPEYGPAIKKAIRNLTDLLEE